MYFLCQTILDIQNKFLRQGESYRRESDRRESDRREGGISSRKECNRDK